jgi:dTDP-4-dehydrorhamnose 3,5-epimerase
MLFLPLEISGTFGIIEPAKSDDRGFLRRIWDINTQLGEFKLTQSSFVTNPRSGTLRGLHYQDEPYSENKVVLCVTGRVFDVILDLRKDSKTSGKYCSYEIGASCEFLGLFVPKGCAHGYLTMDSDSSLVYYMDEEYSAEHARGLRWNDPKFSIKWPSNPVLISERDADWPMH